MSSLVAPGDPNDATWCPEASKMGASTIQNGPKWSPVASMEESKCIKKDNEMRKMCPMAAAQNISLTFYRKRVPQVLLPWPSASMKHYVF